MGLILLQGLKSEQGGWDPCPLTLTTAYAPSFHRNTTCSSVIMKQKQENKHALRLNKNALCLASCSCCFDKHGLILTSCRRAVATICPARLFPCGRRRASRGRADGNIAAVSHGQHVPTRPPLQLPDARWVKRPGDLDLWSFDLESGVRLTCNVGYLCGNFGLPTHLRSRFRPDVRDRQTDVGRQTHIVA